MVDAVHRHEALDGFVTRMRQAGGRRTLLGLAGSPGAGKTTIAHGVLTHLQEQGIRAAVVPMDGFHLADVTLRTLGLLERKGAPETFDADGYLALLERLRARPARTVYAPGFERDLEQPIAASIAIEPEVDVIITEGNYLLLDEEPWAGVAPLLDERWYVELDDHLRRSRLVHRHERFGKSPDAAVSWVDEVDEPNAELVRRSRERAELIVLND